MAASYASSSDLVTENGFWLSIMRDHLLFFDERLSVVNDTDARVKGAISHLLPMAEQLYSQSSSATPQQIREFLLELRILKCTILQLQLEPPGQLSLSLPPTFVSHTLDELDEYLLIVTSYIDTGAPPPDYPLRLHKLWLQDTVGHLASIMSNLDPVEKLLKKRVKGQKKEFEALRDKAIELIGYLRSGDIQPPTVQELMERRELTKSRELPILRQFNATVEGHVLPYLNMLGELADLVASKESVGTVTPDMLDHMMREQTYYINKLSIR
jgi:hypothetical protein